MNNNQLWGIIYQRPDGQWRPILRTYDTKEAAEHDAKDIMNPHEVVQLKS